MIGFKAWVYLGRRKTDHPRRTTVVISVVTAVASGVSGQRCNVACIVTVVFAVLSVTEHRAGDSSNWS